MTNTQLLVGRMKLLCGVALIALSAQLQLVVGMNRPGSGNNPDSSSSKKDGHGVPEQKPDSTAPIKFKKSSSADSSSLSSPNKVFHRPETVGMSRYANFDTNGGNFGRLKQFQEEPQSQPESGMDEWLVDEQSDGRGREITARDAFSNWITALFKSPSQSAWGISSAVVVQISVDLQCQFLARHTISWTECYLQFDTSCPLNGLFKVTNDELYTLRGNPTRYLSPKRLSFLGMDLDSKHFAQKLDNHVVCFRPRNRA